MNWSGGNGGVASIAVYSIGYGANGWVTKKLGVIRAIDNYGWNDGLNAQFYAGKLWVLNPYHASGQTGHFSFTREIVRQFGFHGGALKQETVATVPCGSGKTCRPSNSSIASALRLRSMP